MKNLILQINVSFSDLTQRHNIFCFIVSSFNYRSKASFHHYASIFSLTSKSSSMFGRPVTICCDIPVIFHVMCTSHSSHLLSPSSSCCICLRVEYYTLVSRCGGISVSFRSTYVRLGSFSFLIRVSHSLTYPSRAGLFCPIHRIRGFLFSVVRI